MNILIAGGAGYIGSVLIPRLLDRGYSVKVVDLLWFGNHLPKQVEVLKKDIFDLNTNDLKGIDQVIFLSGLSNDPMAEFSPSMNFVYNAASPAYLAYIAKAAGVKRFIYAGSCSVYGYTVNELYGEEDPAVSNYPYGISKLQGEKAVLQMQEKSFSVICFRQGTVSGYCPRMRLDLFVNTMFKTALEKKEIVINNPSIWRPILGIDDACNQSRLPDPGWLERWLDQQINFDRQWEARVVGMILHNLSQLLEEKIASLQDLNRYRKEVAARLAPLGRAA